MTPEEKKMLQELKERVDLLEKQQIKIVGDATATTVPVTINGLRRNITHSAP